MRKIEFEGEKSNINFMGWGMVILSVLLMLLMYPHSQKISLTIATCLLLTQVFFLLRFYAVNGAARMWNELGIIMAITVGFLFTYLSINRLSGSEDMLISVILWSTYIILSLPFWKLSELYMNKMRERVIKYGRFDFENGVFYPFLMVPPDTTLGKLFVTAGPILLGLMIYSGFHFRRTHPTMEGFIGDILGYLVGVIFLFASSCAYHELRFIRQWEKETGRTMYVAGFGPTAESERSQSSRKKK